MKFLNNSDNNISFSNLNSTVNITSFEEAYNYVCYTLDNILKIGLSDRGLEREEFEKKQNRRKLLSEALKKCTYGDKNAKSFVKDFIIDLLSPYINENNIELLINFSSSKLDVEIKFMILLHHYKKIYGLRGLERLITENELDKLKFSYDDYYYIITVDDIESLYKKFNIELDFKDKLQIVCQLIYQQYKGLGCIDEIRDMAIDGVSGGVSGLPRDLISSIDDYRIYLDQMKADYIPNAYDSVWIMLGGKSIHLDFLSFKSYDELKRVCENIYKYNYPGQLSQAKGYMINKMADTSRVLVVREPYAESWGFFVRKFDVPNIDTKVLLKGKKPELYKNHEMVAELVEFLMKACQTTVITGDQGTGKTTLLSSLIKHIYPTYTLRVQELAFELHLRKNFPYRNILSIQETEDISGQEGINMFKKSDGDITICGEIADDKTASHWLQVGNVASIFTLATHHAKKTRNFIDAITNSLISTGAINDERRAERLVINTLKFDIHLFKDFDGNRYIERITEIVPVDDLKYVELENIKGEKDLNKKINLILDDMALYFRKMTDRKQYICRNIIEYDIDRKQYVVKNPITESKIKDILLHLKQEDRAEFKKFLNNYFKE
jgi:pilus assembly protein CpaF